MTQNELRHTLPPFAMVPRWIIQHENLTSGAVRVYACLADMANRDKNYAFPSHKTLAVKANMSVSSVRRHIDELVNVGALVVRKRFKEDGEGQTSNIYFVKFKQSTTGDKPMENISEGVTKNNPMLTGEQGGYSRVDNEEEPYNNNLYIKGEDVKEHLAKARQMLKNNDSF
jgi:predicted transcriptional regulator